MTISVKYGWRSRSNSVPRVKTAVAANLATLKQIMEDRRQVGAARSAVKDRDRVYLYQVPGPRQRLNPDQRVRRLVIDEQGNSGFLYDRQVLGPVADDKDVDSGHLIRPGARGRQSTAEIGEDLVRLYC